MNKINKNNGQKIKILRVVTIKTQADLDKLNEGGKDSYILVRDTDEQGNIVRTARKHVFDGIVVNNKIVVTEIDGNDVGVCTLVDGPEDLAVVPIDNFNIIECHYNKDCGDKCSDFNRVTIEGYFERKK